MTFPRRLLIEGEDVVLDLRPHWIALTRGVLVAVLVAVAWILLLSRVAKGTTGDVERWLILGIGAALVLAYTVRDVTWWLTSNFVVTTDRIIRREGFVAKRSMEIPLEAINDVRFEQGVFERMIGAGTLVIQSASEAGREEFSDVRDPEMVQRTIYHESELNQQRMRGGGGGPTASQAPSVTTELQRLADLRERGVLTEAEFEDQKARILRGRAP